MAAAAAAAALSRSDGRRTVTRHPLSAILITWPCQCAPTVSGRRLSESAGIRHCHGDRLAGGRGGVTTTVGSESGGTVSTRQAVRVTGTVTVTVTVTVGLPGSVLGLGPSD